MGSTINPIRLQKYKLVRRKGWTIERSMIYAGLSPSTAKAQNRSTRLGKVGDAQILEEMQRDGLIGKAFFTLEDALTAKKTSDRIAAAQNILRFTEGEKHQTLNPDTIVIVDKSYRQEIITVPSDKEKAISCKL